MDIAFYIAAAIAITATLLVITNANAVHALLYLIVSLLAVAVVFYVLGAPFAAALEVIVYAGAIVVLFVFVVMMLGVGRDATLGTRNALDPGAWLGPALLAAVLAAELAYVLVASGQGAAGASRIVAAKELGVRLFGPYLLAVELASLLLLAALVGAYHIGRRIDDREGR
jgi:NADH-quinone oxidoreductase subunit J